MLVVYVSGTSPDLLQVILSDVAYARIVYVSGTYPELLQVIQSDVAYARGLCVKKMTQNILINPNTVKQTNILFILSLFEDSISRLFFA